MKNRFLCRVINKKTGRLNKDLSAWISFRLDQEIGKAYNETINKVTERLKAEGKR